MLFISELGTANLNCPSISVWHTRIILTNLIYKKGIYGEFINKGKRRETKKNKK